MSLDIDNIFVPLVLERVGLNEGYDHKSLRTAGNRILLIGDPGSGKTSIAKRVFRDECTRSIRLPRLTRFPVLIELRRVELPKKYNVSNLGDWLFNYIKTQATEYNVYDIERCFDAYATTSGLLIILDGLDEVSSTTYKKMELAINQLSSKLRRQSEKNTLILTMRSQFHRQVREYYAAEFPIVMSLRRFSPSDIYEFLQRWPFSLLDKAANVVRIFSDLTDRPTLREMCTNPLVLSMYVAQDQISGSSDIPESRTEFYSRVAEELIIRRRAHQVGPAKAQAVQREQRQRIFGRIALDHLLDATQSTNLISWTSGVDVLADVTGLDHDAATTYLKQIESDTGLITQEREGETFRYIHLTFCEFFAAFEAVQGRGDGWETLVDTHRRFQSDPAQRTRLAEVLPFACALMPRHMRENAIRDVARLEDIHVLALTFLETKLYAHPIWPTFIDSFGASLLSRSEADWDAQWLSELHLFLVVAADAERSAGLIKGMTKSDRIDLFFREFAQKSPTAISTLISSYARQDAAAAFRIATLCHIDVLEHLPGLIVENCDQPPFLGIALERASRDASHAERWAPLFAEAGLRSEATASSLSRRNERPWAELAARVARKHRWEAPYLLKESLYTDCLSVETEMIGSEEKRDAPLVVLSLLSEIPSPNSTYYGTLLCFAARYSSIALFLYIFILVILIEAQLLEIIIERQVFKVGFFPLLLMMIASILLSPIPPFSNRYLRAYANILNVGKSGYLFPIPIAYCPNFILKLPGFGMILQSQMRPREDQMPQMSRLDRLVLGRSLYRQAVLLLEARARLRLSGASPG